MDALTPREVTRYYRWLLDRDPEPEVLRHYEASGLRRLQLVQMIVASDEFAQRLQRLGAPSPEAAAVPPPPSVHDAALWQRYVPFLNVDSPVPFREVAFQTYHVPTAAGSLTIKSMLSSVELALLYALAKDHWSGEGEIVDLGCLYGLTTRCFAEGLMANSRVPDTLKVRRIYAYDLFLAENYDWWSQQSPTVHAGSWFPEFLDVNRDQIDAIVPCPGNLLNMNWGTKPVEILMIDASKSWDLNAWIVGKFFPRLIPGKSVVIQQDQVHYIEYWIMITMEWFSDHFTYIDTIYGSSAYYLCTAPISEEQACVELEALPFSEKERLLLGAIARCRPSAQAALQGTYAKLLLDHGLHARAREVLERMDVTCLSDDPVYDFSGIARSDRDQLLALLAQTTA